MDKVEIVQAVVITGICGTLGWFIQFIMKGFKVHENSHELLKDANLYQIKATLLFMYRHAKDNNDIVTIQELEVFNNLYEVYKALGGNGFIETINDKMNSYECIDD